MAVKLKKNKSKSDKSRSTWNSRKYVMTVTDFFHVQSEVPRVKSRQLFYKKKSLEGHLLWAFCQDLELQVALTGRKKPVWGPKKAAKNFFDANLHFEPHKIGF